MYTGNIRVLVPGGELSLVRVVSMCRPLGVRVCGHHSGLDSSQNQAARPRISEPYQSDSFSRVVRFDGCRDRHHIWLSRDDACPPSRSVCGFVRRYQTRNRDLFAISPLDRLDLVEGLEGVVSPGQIVDLFQVESAAQVVSPAQIARTALVADPVPLVGLDPVLNPDHGEDDVLGASCPAKGHPRSVR